MNKKIPMPDERRLSSDNPYFNQIIKKHSEAYLNNEAVYIDPETGLVVFTAYFLEKRGFCCGNACRHCPFLSDD